ncbi:MAG: signal recognition particle receptor subunit alpha [Candidatus ainarchaeum sp.]|nr:signal recognition particle receptor subunit alpha [Candidatus ainarchaeum sp.]
MSFGEKLRNAIDKISGAGLIDEKTVKEVIKEIQRALIGANVDITTVLQISKDIERKAMEKPAGKLTQKEHIAKVIYDELVEMMNGKEAPVEPNKILLCGLFGAGKTTAAGKLANYYKKRGKKVGVIAADTYRPAAFEQLKTNCEQAGAKFFGLKDEKDLVKIIREGNKELQDCNLIICDSAGRSGLDAELITEIKLIDKEFNAQEKWLVLSSDIGNLAKKQAIAFHNALGINGVIITKMDGSSKGGGALVACKETGASVYFISTGEKINDFEAFDSNRYLSRIMGYGDLEGLLEKVKEIEMDNIDPEQMMSGDLNFKVFYQQLQATKKMGPLNKVIDMLGFGNKLPKEALEMGQEKMDSFKVIIDSMTEQERLNPDLLNRSRIERIAKGAGKNDREIRELLKHFKKMKKMFKTFKGMNENSMKKMGERDLAKMMQQMQGKKGIKKKFRLK